MGLYNQHLPQKALNRHTPLMAMKKWYESHPHLFKKIVINHPVIDIHKSDINSYKILKKNMSLRLLRLFIGSILNFFLFAASWAQGDPAFFGMKSVALTVESIREPEASRCNITRGAIDSAARVILDRSRLRVNTSSTEFLYISVNVLSHSSLCAANVNVAIQRGVSIPDTSTLVFLATVWDKGVIITGPSHDFGTRVYQAVSNYTTEMLSEWIKANPR